MLNDFFLSVVVGTFLGFLSGLGTGGGSLLILYLTLVQNMPQEEARLLNLMYFLPSALIACLLLIRKGNLPLKKILPAMIAGSIAAAVFAWFSGSWNTELLRKAFGILLLATGIRELMYQPKKARD